MTRQKVIGLNGRRPAAIAVALLLLLAVPYGEAQKSSRSVVMSERITELAALEKRAQTLAGEMAGFFLRKIKNDPRGAWDRLFVDFDQWAHKFNVPTQDKTLPTTESAGPGGTINRDYPLVTEGPPGVAGYFCLKDFSRSTVAQFVYKCYRE